MSGREGGPTGDSVPPPACLPASLSSPRCRPHLLPTAGHLLSSEVLVQRPLRFATTVDSGSGTGFVAALPGWAGSARPQPSSRMQRLLLRGLGPQQLCTSRPSYQKAKSPCRLQSRSCSLILSPAYSPPPETTLKETLNNARVPRTAVCKTAVCRGALQRSGALQSSAASALAGARWEARGARLCVPAAPSSGAVRYHASGTELRGALQAPQQSRPLPCAVPASLQGRGKWMIRKARRAPFRTWWEFGLGGIVGLPKEERGGLCGPASQVESHPTCSVLCDQRARATGRRPLGASSPAPGPEPGALWDGEFRRVSKPRALMFLSKSVGQRHRPIIFMGLPPAWRGLAFRDTLRGLWV